MLFMMESISEADSAAQLQNEEKIQASQIPLTMSHQTPSKPMLDKENVETNLPNQTIGDSQQLVMEENEKGLPTSHTEPMTPQKSSIAPIRSLAAQQAEIKKKTSGFFARLMNEGVALNILQKDTWKLVHIVFSPESGALHVFRNEAEAKTRDIKNRLHSVTLRRFKCDVPSLSHSRFAIHTPNNEYHFKPITPEDKDLWLAWVKTMESEQQVIDSQARTMHISTSSNQTNSNSRPSFWIPSEEAHFCGHVDCKVPLSMRRSHTCRSCGFMFCHASACFIDSMKICAQCLKEKSTQLNPNVS